MGRTIYKREDGKKIITEHYRKYLESFNFNVERLFIDTAFGKTHVLVAGPEAGKPIFVLQGGNCINPMTLSWFSSLTDKYRIYAPDTIGHPGKSAENRVSAKDHSFADWIEELMDYFNIKSSAFIGPSYGAGIILRLATFKPHKIDCAVLVSPAGISVGSKLKMLKDILIPLTLFNVSSSKKHLNKITHTMSDNSMKEIDKEIIGDVFKYIKLEREMPKLTRKKELKNYHSPTLIIAGKKDIFFPEHKLKKDAKRIFPNLTAFSSYDIGHFPSEVDLIKINEEILEFLRKYY